MSEIQKSSGKSSKKKPNGNDLDYLTGIWKKDMAEMQIMSKINKGRRGTLFLCDVDYLKRINEQYGHLSGDECLKQVAQILSYMTCSEDILGRRGGDEFIIFMPECKDARQAQNICGQLEKRFRTNRGKGRISFSVTVAYALWESGDTCQKLIERAEAELARRKAELNIHEQQEEKKDHYIKDVRLVRKELIEQIQKPGAYCQNYETFKSIYRFLERGIIRSGQKACVILITVVDEQGESLLPHEKDVLMERLGKDIGDTLRIGDVYTRYSSSQYLALVMDTTEGQADIIVDRIKNQFLAGGGGKDVLIHHCYELQPARIGKQVE